VIRWKSHRWKEIEGLRDHPSGYQAGQKVPLILNIAVVKPEFSADLC
jgi:hypothetical protein